MNFLELYRKTILRLIFMVCAVVLLHEAALVPDCFAEKIETPQGTMYKPDAQGVYPAVVLLHGVAGLNPVLYEIAQSLSENGYAALVINYYTKGGRSPEFARWRLFQSIVGDTVTYLQTLPYVKKHSICIVGYSQGAILAVTSAAGIPDVKAVVAFYGPNPQGNWFLPQVYNKKENESPYYLNKSIKNLPPIQLHHGNQDSVAAVTESEEFYKLLKANGKIAEIFIYEGQQHAFNYPSYAMWFNAAAAKLSLERTINFFNKYLMQAGKK
ncbi:MAG TPA: dienelactone hydrolase family protein [Smithellaceae bacterium]|nr:dienelactone hydrolase family protein [Smithellaceae bacterium]